jgi:uncharacterized protein YbaR (Trm112 family)
MLAISHLTLEQASAQEVASDNVQHVMIQQHNSKNMNLLDILACPICKGDVTLVSDRLQCANCDENYPIVNGVPVMMPGVDPADIRHEAPLVVREGYDGWIHRMVLQSLADDQIVIDAGSGNMKLNDPCLIRMDVTLTPYVDLVADLHALPFKSESVDYIFSCAVVEHVRQPFVAAQEMYRALKPGGYVYGECCFIFAYHGYPDHYFNASIHGMEQIFSSFRKLHLRVAPYQTPAFALDNIISVYLHHFRPDTPQASRFADLLRQVLTYPLRYYDSKLEPGSDFRLAAGSCFLGMKQPTGAESTLPGAVLAAYRANPELQQRFPDPNDLSLPDNVMFWAKGEGRQSYPEIDSYFSACDLFSKYLPGQSGPAKRSLPDVPRTAPPDLNVIVEPDRIEREHLADIQRRKQLFLSDTPRNQVYQVLNSIRMRLKTLFRRKALFGPS